MYYFEDFYEKKSVIALLQICVLFFVDVSGFFFLSSNGNWLVIDLLSGSKKSWPISRSTMPSGDTFSEPEPAVDRRQGLRQVKGTSMMVQYVVIVNIMVLSN